VNNEKCGVIVEDDKSMGRIQEEWCEDGTAGTYV